MTLLKIVAGRSLVVRRAAVSGFICDSEMQGCSAITNKQNSFLAGMMVFISGDGHSIQTRVVTHCVV